MLHLQFIYVYTTLSTHFTPIVYRQQLAHLALKMLYYVMSLNPSMHQNDKHALCVVALQCSVSFMRIYAGSHEAMWF